MSERQGAAGAGHRGSGHAEDETARGATGAAPAAGTGHDAAGPVRPQRPGLYVGEPPPRLALPEPPVSQGIASRAWKVCAVGLAVAVGMSFLDLGGRRQHVRSMLLEQAPGADEGTVGRAVDVAFWSGLGAWAVLAVAALLLSSGLRRPRWGPRLLGVVGAAAVISVVLYTVLPLVPPGGVLGAGARLALALAALASAVAAVLGLLPGAWRWVREHRTG